MYDEAGNLVSAEPVRRRKLGATTTDRLGSPRSLHALADFARLERAYLDASNARDEIRCVLPHLVDASAHIGS